MSGHTKHLSHLQHLLVLGGADDVDAPAVAAPTLTLSYTWDGSGGEWHIHVTPVSEGATGYEVFDSGSWTAYDPEGYEIVGPNTSGNTRQYRAVKGTAHSDGVSASYAVGSDPTPSAPGGVLSYVWVPEESKYQVMVELTEGAAGGFQWDYGAGWVDIQENPNADSLQLPSSTGWTASYRTFNDYGPSQSTQFEWVTDVAPSGAGDPSYPTPPGVDTLYVTFSEILLFAYPVPFVGTPTHFISADEGTWGLIAGENAQGYEVQVPESNNWFSIVKAEDGTWYAAYIEGGTSDVMVWLISVTLVDGVWVPGDVIVDTYTIEVPESFAISNTGVS